MENFSYLNCFRFSLQLMFCESLFLLSLPRRKQFPVRVAFSVALYFGMLYLILLIYRLVPGYVLPVSMTFYAVCWLFTMVVIYSCYDVPFVDVLFAGIGGYALQHSGYSLMTLVRYFTDVRIGDVLYNSVFSTVPYLLVGFAAYFAVIRPNADKGELKKKDWRFVILSLIILFSSIVLSLLADYSPDGNYNMFVSNVVCRAYAVISCGLILFVMFGLSRKNKLEHDNEIVEHLLRMERSQNEVAKENIEIINIKCHDLKHQIAELKKVDNREEREVLIDEMEKAVMIYDSVMKTGCDALDLVLTEKSLICEKHKIKLSCIIDGSRLGFMNIPDIYSLFGNALDNAIESVSAAAETEKRLISLRISAEHDILLIHLDNYCPVPPVFEDGLPVTTKGDRDYHGFGVKSIRHIVNKYGGELRMSATDDKFFMDILFFLKK